MTETGRKTANNSKLDSHEEEIIQLLKSGSTQKAIAEKYKVTPATVNYWLNKHRVKSDTGNSKKCRTCQYRETDSKKGNCDYIGKTGHRRGCSSTDCDKYVKGDPLPGPRERN